MDDNRPRMFVFVLFVQNQLTEDDGVHDPDQNAGFRFFSRFLVYLLCLRLFDFEGVLFVAQRQEKRQR